MANRPDFTKSNVINDPSMAAAFQQGLDEGMANRDTQIIIKIEVFFEGVKLNERIFPIEKGAEAHAFLAQNLVTVGQEAHVEIMWATSAQAPEKDSAPALEAGDDEIVDAEVVEED